MNTDVYSGGRAWPSSSLLNRPLPEDRDDLLALGTRVEFATDTQLLHEGERSVHVFLLLSGLTKVTADTPDGTMALLAVRAGGDLIGELSTLDNEPRLATVTAVGSVVTRRISQAVFAGYLRTHPEAALAVNMSISGKLRWSTRRRVDFSGYPVLVRLARLLIELLRSYGEVVEGGLAIDLALSQPELAALIGAAEPSIQRAMRELRQRGVLLPRYRHVVIIDEAQLREIAGHEAH